jgi:hypothetical protein
MGVCSLSDIGRSQSSLLRRQLNRDTSSFKNPPLRVSTRDLRRILRRLTRRYAFCVRSYPLRASHTSPRKHTRRCERRRRRECSEERSEERSCQRTPLAAHFHRRVPNFIGEYFFEGGRCFFGFFFTFLRSNKEGRALACQKQQPTNDDAAMSGHIHSNDEDGE